MKAMFAWLSLLTSLANLFAVASGQPEEGPAKLKTFIPEVRIWLFVSMFLTLVKVFDSNW